VSNTIVNGWTSRALVEPCGDDVIVDAEITVQVLTCCLHEQQHMGQWQQKQVWHQ